MSKAITKETDADDDESPALPALPAGSKNYITPQGYARMRAELFELIDNERPKVVEVVHRAAIDGDRSENGRPAPGVFQRAGTTCGMPGITGSVLAASLAAYSSFNARSVL
jgi:hypothetical protein